MSEVSAPPRPVGRRIPRFICAVGILLSFIPYLALPIGSGTAFGLSGLAGILAWVSTRRSPRLDLVLVTLLVMPLTTNAVATVIYEAPMPTTGALTWAGTVGNIALGAVALRELGSDLKRLLSTAVILTSLAAYAQLAFIGAGTIPFLNLYRAPGYASVESNASNILTYIKRPFAQFPEPSFLAGTILLALFAIVLMNRAHAQPWNASDKAALGLGAVCILLTESGSAVVGLAALALAVSLSSRRTLRTQVGAVALISVGVIAGLWVLSQRSGIGNFSWGDRLGSIAVGAELWVSSLLTVLFGMGRGGVTAAFTADTAPSHSYVFVQQPSDVYSALIRVLFEYGALGGGVVLVLLASAMLKMRTIVGPSMTVLSMLLWVLVGGLTISYEAAAWVWVLPGLCFGLILMIGGRDENTSRH